MLYKKDLMSTKELVLTALMTALVFLAGSIIKIPSLGGFIHIGDTMVFTSVVILGKRRGAAASALGMFFVDVFGGYYLWAPFTFIIKGTMAYITGTFSEKADENNKLGFIIACSFGGIFMIVGYLLSGTILAAFLTEKVGLLQGFIYSSKDIVGNVIQVVTGIILALPLSSLVISAKKKVLG